LVVGIDDTYVKHREHSVARQFQITAGRVERNGKLGARFVFVSSNPGWTESFFDGFLLQQGMKRNTVMRVVTDGDDGLRNFVQRSSPRPMESQLDWFHIGMKLELLRKAVVMPVTYSFAMARPNPLPVIVVSVNASDPNNSQRTPAMDPLFRDEPFDEAEPGAHRSHGVRAGRANANDKQIHHADLQYSLCIGMRALRF
jgi:hypothetical protein